MSKQNKSTKTPGSIQIRNPLIVQRVVNETAAGVGRNLTETAENLILKGVDANRDSVAPSPEKRENKSVPA